MLAAHGMQVVLLTRCRTVGRTSQVMSMPGHMRVRAPRVDVSVLTDLAQWRRKTWRMRPTGWQCFCQLKGQVCFAYLVSTFLPLVAMMASTQHHHPPETDSASGRQSMCAGVERSFLAQSLSLPRQLFFLPDTAGTNLGCREARTTSKAFSSMQFWTDEH